MTAIDQHGLVACRYRHPPRVNDKVIDIDERDQACNWTHVDIVAGLNCSVDTDGAPVWHRGRLTSPPAFARGTGPAGRLDAVGGSTENGPWL